MHTVSVWVYNQRKQRAPEIKANTTSGEATPTIFSCYANIFVLKGRIRNE